MKCMCIEPEESFSDHPCWAEECRTAYCTCGGRYWTDADGTHPGGDPECGCVTA